MLGREVERSEAARGGRKLWEQDNAGWGLPGLGESDLLHPLAATR